MRDGTILNINANQLNYLKNLSFNLKVKEHGGIVIGTKLIKNNFYTVIDFYYMKNTSTKENRYSCDAKEANRYIYNQWEKSFGINNYIGEWHTHNENYPSPSRIDRFMMEDILKRNNAPNKIFLFILGKKQIYVGAISIKKRFLHKLGEINI